MRRSWTLAALLLAPSPVLAGFFPSSPFSDAAAGTTGAAFLKIPVGARLQALGDSGAAAADNSEALFWNPAGLARLQGAGLSEASASYSALLEGAQASALAYARPLRESRGTWGASLLYVSQGTIAGYTPVGDQSGSFAPYDLALAGGYARAWRGLLFGGALKVLRSELAGASASTFAVDLGAQALRATDLGEGPLDLGLSLRNLGPPIRLGGSSAPLPFSIRGGSLWRFNPRLNLLLDAVLPVDEKPYVALGVEAHAPLGGSVAGAVRAGYDMRNTRNVDGLSGVTAGFGLEMGRVRLDYAWVPLGDLGTTNRISLGVKF